MWEYIYLSWVQVCPVYALTFESSFNIVIINNTKTLYYNYIGCITDAIPVYLSADFSFLLAIKLSVLIVVT